MTNPECGANLAHALDTPMSFKKRQESLNTATVKNWYTPINSIVMTDNMLEIVSQASRMLVVHLSFGVFHMAYTMKEFPGIPTSTLKIMMLNLTVVDVFVYSNFDSVVCVLLTNHLRQS